MLLDVVRWCVDTLAQVWKQLLKREASAEKAISLKRLSKLGRQQKSAELQIWHSGLGSEHAAPGAAFEGQGLWTGLHCVQTLCNRATGVDWLSLLAGMQLTSSFTPSLNRSSARAWQHLSPSPLISVTWPLLSSWERGGEEKQRERDISGRQIGKGGGHEVSYNILYIDCQGFGSFTDQLLSGFDSRWSKMKEFIKCDVRSWWLFIFLYSQVKKRGHCSTYKGAFLGHTVTTMTQEKKTFEKVTRVITNSLQLWSGSCISWCRLKLRSSPRSLKKDTLLHLMVPYGSPRLLNGGTPKFDPCTASLWFHLRLYLKGKWWFVKKL